MNVSVKLNYNDCYEEMSAQNERFFLWVRVARVTCTVGQTLQARLMSDELNHHPVMSQHVQWAKCIYWTH